MLIGRTVLFDVVRTFLGTLGATTAMAFFLMAITFMKETPGIGLDFLVTLLPLFIPLSMQFTVPVSMLVAVVIAFGRMQGAGELTALSASGINLVMIVWPVLAFAAAISLGSLMLVDITSPYAATHLTAAKRDFAETMQTSFRAGMRDVSLHSARLSFDSYDRGEFRDIFVEIKQDERNSRLLRARTGAIRITEDDRFAFDLDQLHVMVPQAQGGGRTFASVDLVSGDVDLGAMDLGVGATRKRGDLQAWELAWLWKRGLPNKYGARVKTASAAEELARRTAMAGAVFFFALVGVSLGILSGRRTRVAGVIVGMAPVLITYFPLIIVGSNLARNGRMSPYPALWMGNAAMALIGTVMLARLVRR